MNYYYFYYFNYFTPITTILKTIMYIKHVYLCEFIINYYVVCMYVT